MIKVYKPYLPKESLRFAHEALDSTWISSHGPYIDMVTEKLQDLLGVKHVLLTNNGTSATHLVAKALTFCHPEIKKIIVPNNVYVAAINSFIFDRNIQLISIDADLDTWNYDLGLLDKVIKENLNEPLAVLCVHNVGNIINVPELKRKYPSVVFVEDNCEGLFGKYEGFYSGTASLASSISFYGNKTICAGESGAVLTNNTDLYEYLKCFHGQGQSTTRFVHSQLGNNFRITNVQAAILYGQLEQLENILDLKKKIFDSYHDMISKIDGVQFQTQLASTQHSNWMFGVRVVGNPHGYSHAENFFKKANIEIRPMFYPISAHTHLKSESLLTHYTNEVNAEILNKECFILPSYPELTKDDLSHINETLKLFVSSVSNS